MSFKDISIFSSGGHNKFVQRSRAIWLIWVEGLILGTFGFEFGPEVQMLKDISNFTMVAILFGRAELFKQVWLGSLMRNVWVKLF